MDEFDQRCKKMPKEIKTLRPYKKCEEAIFSFVNSLPLIQNLKNDALREQVLVRVRVRGRGRLGLGVGVRVRVRAWVRLRVAK